VVVDTPLLDLVERAIIEEVCDTDLILVLLHKVTKSNSRLEANEAGGEVEKQVSVGFFCEQTQRLDGASKPNPRATRLG